MKNLIKTFVISISILLLAVSLCACNSDTSTENESTLTSAAESERVVDSETLKSELIGEWGRLDEVMHCFYDDETCVIGGMIGTFDIDENNNLILTTTDGISTSYEWAVSSAAATSANYWYLENDTVKINGNTFTKIIEDETEDTVK